jgi:nucleotide-binding universal stress UspA family protein
MTKFHARPGSIVVGVDGSEDAQRALTWAARQAALENRTLAVVHSADQLALRDTAWLDVQGIDHRELVEALDLAAEAILTRALEQAKVAAPGVEVTTHLVRDDARIALAEASASAHLVVVGSRGRGPLRSALLGSVSASLVKHAEGPVVVCRPPETRQAYSDRIVVGADGTSASVPVLEFGFAQASLRGAPLTVMHCFWDVLAPADGPGGLPSQREDREDLTDLRLLLAESVAGLAEKYPDVAVTQELARGLVDECLADRAPDAALVVVGRTSSSGWSRFPHTSCAVAVLERAHTTVAVVPESTRGEEER